MTDSLDSEAFYKLPLAFVFYSMTFYLVGLYPVALLTQHLLRRGMRTGSAEPFRNEPVYDRTMPN